MKHAHMLDVTKDELIEAVNLLREKRGKPTLPEDDTSARCYQNPNNTFEAGEHGGAIMVSFKWEVIE